MTTKNAGFRKGNMARITNVILKSGKGSIARRYLDRRGEVLKVDNKKGVALLGFNNRISPLEVPLNQLELA